jgi:glycerol-3-phosphate dehydrogenase subunit C
LTTIYDPKHPKYLDEGDVRDELVRVYDLCHGCRLCFKFCSAFPTLFEFIDRHDDQDSAKLTIAEQDQVVDECFQCKLCYINCPYIPGQSEWELDFPRLMLRADAMRHAKGGTPLRTRLTTNTLARTDLVGRMGTLAAPMANAVTAKPGTFVRKVIARTAGIAEKRVLPPFARQRFSTWFRKRPKIRLTKRQADVALFQTCLVEYQNPAIGQDLVKVYERNGIECSLVAGDTTCCGAPWLHSGDIDNFTKQATKNVEALAAAVRDGKDIVVPQPTCGLTLKMDYPDYVGTDDARLVAEHTYDAAEYLMKIHKGADTSLDLEFPGEVPATVTYHTPCHLRMQQMGLKSRDLMKLTGTKITLVQQCSGMDGTWGLREENYDLSLPLGQKLAAEIDRADGEVVSGDCHLANTVIVEQTGRTPLHPLQVMARAYGIPEER